MSGAALVNDRTHRHRPRALEDEYHDARSLLQSEDPAQIREGHLKLIGLAKKFVLRSTGALTQAQALVAVKYFVGGKTERVISREIGLPYRETRELLFSAVTILNRQYREDLLPQLPHVGRKIFRSVARELDEFAEAEERIPEIRYYACEFHMALH